MEITRKKPEEENENSENPVELAKKEAEKGIAGDPDFMENETGDDLDEGELAKLDNSND